MQSLRHSSGMHEDYPVVVNVVLLVVGFFYYKTYSK